MEQHTLYKTDTREYRGEWIEYIHGLQDTICNQLQEADGKAVFNEDEWDRLKGKDGEAKGGGGKTRTISNGDLFEKGGVNTSVVYGSITDKMRTALNMEGSKWFACGLSLVLHPSNPFVPTVHANWRYFELYDENDNVSGRWFGGGTDLTPYYLFEEDARYFHQSLKDSVQPFGEELYPLYKKQCDDYFVNTHRNNERRGIGGIFYDRLKVSDEDSARRLLAFQQANGNNFLQAYLPIAEKRRDTPYNAGHKYWQEIRRGRYVEFNLIHDHGTLFGLRTNGRTESILMSLPPTVRFEYNYQPQPGTEEDKLLQVCLAPREWAM